nr:carbohydrate kinase [Corynebacterium pacaense]
MITVCGEGLIDLVPTDQAAGPLSPLQPALGGGPFNAAIASARLGGEVQFLSRLSTDAFGEALHAALRHNGVSTNLVQRGEEPTTLAVSSIDDSGSASFNFYVEGTADRLVDPPTVMSGYACFGTVSLVLEPGAGRYLELLRTMSDAGSFIALDPNIRTISATDTHRSRLLSVLDRVHLLKLSEDEVDFFGGPDVIASVPLIVITRGGDGLTLVRGSTVIDIPPAEVEVVDTIGAGDTILAALIVELARRGIGVDGIPDIPEDTLAGILRFAAAAAAITCSRQGAQPPTRDEVEALLNGAPPA